MSYNHKISDLKYRINGLVPSIVCKNIIEIFEKYPELNVTEESYKYKTKKIETDNFRCLNLSRINNADKNISYALSEAKKYISIMIANYVLHIKNKKICLNFNDHLIRFSDNISIIRYEKDQCIKDHSDIGS